MLYLSKIPKLVRQFYADYTWRVKRKDKVLFLTFDDGPVPGVTDWVLQQLHAYQAKASFFLLGRQVQAHPELAHAIIDQGHCVGNHSHAHRDGWKTDNKLYLRDFLQGEQTIKEYTGYQTTYFRPPYARISRSQAQHIMRSHEIVMMDVVSGDFDETISEETCFQNVVATAKSGSIILFHDTKKAMPRMQAVLPRVLEHFDLQGYRFLGLDDRES
ncbi:MAG: polysaccharide deacetylase family protein [Bacteroidota bacterium]